MIEPGNNYEVGNSRCRHQDSRQHINGRNGEDIRAAPRSENLARSLTAVSYRTAEALHSPERVWESNQGNAIETQTECRESDTFIVP